MYRYKSITKYLLDELKDGYIYFNAPIEFNDPFEFQYDIRKIEIAARAWAGLTYEKVNRPISRSDFENGYEECLKILSAAMSGKRQELLYGRGVCCFTERSNNYLLWSHYANGHRGICIGYRDWAFPKDKIVRINYENEYPDIPMCYDTGIDGSKIADLILSTKRIDWSYEEESRIYFHKAREMDPLRVDSIEEIIFGIKCKTEDIDAVVAVAMVHNPNIKFKRVVIEKDSTWNMKFAAI